MKKDIYSNIFVLIGTWMSWVRAPSISTIASSSSDGRAPG